jgi:signal transduction histidine kinase
MRRLRRRFVRMLGCSFAAFFVFLILASSALTWIFTQANRGPGFVGGYHGFWPLGGVAGFVLIVGGLVFTIRSLRRAALPVDELLEGVGRVADGDYSKRVDENGPSETRVLAQAINQMAERLQANEQQRRDLLADVTHELRTPITVIQGNLEGMLDGIYPADSDHLESILEETRVLSRVIEDLRTLSLAEGGALKLQLQSTDIGELIEETAEAFQAQAAAGGVSLRVELAPDLPLAEADPTRIREVLANLVSNALRYTPAEGVIQLSCRVDTPKEVCVSVHDTGRGIAPEDLPHIFDRFYKGHDSRGTGLGLAIVKSLVTAHHGQIGATSKPGEGTTIEFSLPTAP